MLARGTWWTPTRRFLAVVGESTGKIREEQSQGAIGKPGDMKRKGREKREREQETKSQQLPVFPGSLPYKCWPGLTLLSFQV